MVLYKEITGTGSAGGWLVLQLHSWWQTKQRLPWHHSILSCRRWLTSNTRSHQYHFWQSLVHGTLKASTVCQQCQHMKKDHDSHLRCHCQRCPHLDFIPPSAFLTLRVHTSLNHVHTRGHLHAPLPFQPLPGGTGKSLRACEWQLAHQHAEMQTYLSWVKENLYFSCCSSYLLNWTLNTDRKPDAVVTDMV